MGKKSELTEQLEQLLADVLDANQQKWEETQVRVNQSLGGIMLRGARAVQIGTGGTQRPTTASASLLGWSVRETSGAAPALVYLRDGNDNTDPILAVLRLSANESTRDWLGPGGISVGEGVFVDVAAGSIEGVVYLRGSE